MNPAAFHRCALLLAATLASPAATAVSFLTEENPPLNYTQNAQLTGTAVAVVREIARRAAVSGDMKVLAWPQAFAQAESDAEACVFSTVRSPERNKRFQWIGPIARGEYSAFARDGFAERIAKVDDLKKFRIGAVRDARATHLRQRGFTAIWEFDDDRHIPLNLTTDLGRPGGLDIWFTQGARALDIARSAGVNDLKVVFRGVLSQDYYLACNLNFSREQFQAMSAALAAMKKDGTFQQMATAAP